MSGLDEVLGSAYRRVVCKAIIDRSQILPGVVDKLTPNGRLPMQAEIAQTG
jgi:hypothetical protein